MIKPKNALLQKTNFESTDNIIDEFQKIISTVSDIKELDNVHRHTGSLNSNRENKNQTKDCFPTVTDCQSTVKIFVRHDQVGQTTTGIIKHIVNRTPPTVITSHAQYVGRAQLKRKSYPPPFPGIPPHRNQPTWNRVPPSCTLKIEKINNTIRLTWDMKKIIYVAKTDFYELYICKQTDAVPDVSMWKKLADIPATKLPMTCMLNNIEHGFIYHFALRAVDEHNRRAPFTTQYIFV